MYVCMSISVAVAVAACMFSVSGSAPLVLFMLTLLLASLLRPKVRNTSVIESPGTTRSAAVAGGPPGCCLSAGSGCAVAGSSGGPWLGGG